MGALRGGWICQGCGKTHSMNVPYFAGPEKATGNLYCKDSHPGPEKPWDDPEEIRTALHWAARDTGYTVTSFAKSDAFREWIARTPCVWTWDGMVEAGKSYLVGRDTPTKEYIRKNTSALSKMLALAVRLAQLDPTCEVQLTNNKRRLEYQVYDMGEYVEIALPHHDMGGERHWITKDGKSRLLVNVD